MIIFNAMGLIWVKLKKIWPQLLILASLLFFFREIIFFGKTFIPLGLGLGDHNLSFIPLAHYASQVLKTQMLPLWDPYTLGGFPLIGSGVIHLYYHPLNFIFFYLF